MKGQGMSKQSKKVDQLKAEIRDSALDSQHKSYAADVLGEVEEVTNGCPDKIQGVTEALLSMTGYMIRRDILLQEIHASQLGQLTEVIDAALEKHRQDCPLAVKWDGETERRGRDGRDGRDSITISGKGAKVTGPGAIVRFVSVLAFVGWMAFLGAKGAGWL